MSAVPVLAYVIGIGVFSGVSWFLNGIKDLFVETSMYENNAVFTLFQYVWTGAFVIFLIGGGIYLIRQYSEKRYQGGF